MEPPFPAHPPATGIAPARMPDDLALIRGLFRDYAASLGVDLCFQGFEAELAGLPGAYAPPQGAILLARHRGRVMGCIAMRPLGEGVCEMKRLYLRPEARGLGLGRELADAVVAAARAAGHRRMVLDTLESLAAARSLYARMGFQEIAPYYDNPLPDVRYYGLTL